VTRQTRDGGRGGRAAGAGSRGHLLIIGGAEDRVHGLGALEKFIALAGGTSSHIVLITTATEIPEEVSADYGQIFRKLGAGKVTPLRLEGRGAADDEHTLAVIARASGIFISGGDQARIRTVVGSQTNVLLSRRLHDDDVVIAGTSAGATAIGRTMILGGEGPDVSASSVRTGPGLGLLPGVLIDMHFSERGRLPRLLSAIALDPGHLGVGIDENTAILVSDDKFQVLGTGVVSVVDAEDATVAYAVADDDPITLFDVRLHLLPAGCAFDLVDRTPYISAEHPGA
jgi:cyanophycinase